MADLLEEIAKLSREEKFELLEQVYSSLIIESSEPEIQNWQKHELERREHNFLNGISNPISINELKNEVHKKYGI